MKNNHLHGIFSLTVAGNKQFTIVGLMAALYYLSDDTTGIDTNTNASNSIDPPLTQDIHMRTLHIRYIAF